VRVLALAVRVVAFLHDLIVAAFVHALIVVVLPLVVLVLTRTVVTTRIPGVTAVRPPSIAGLALVARGTMGEGGCRR